MQLIQKNELECKILISNLAGELLHTTVAKKYKDTLHPTFNSLFVAPLFTKIPGSKTKD